MKKKKTGGASVPASRPKPSPGAARTLREKILASPGAKTPPFLPVFNPDFASCSNAIAKLHTCTDPHHRPLRLPSALIPLLP